MRSKFCLTLADTDFIIDACRKEALRNQWSVSIAIVDDAGFLIQSVRLDDAGTGTADAAALKAKTAAATGLSTQIVEERSTKRPALFSVPGRLALQGGVPIRYQEQCVGAIGVSGVQSHQDEQVANAGLAAFQTALP
jgi:glc operon protein GlcG